MDLKLGIQLQHDHLYRASPFQVCRTSTSCLPSRLRGFLRVKLTFSNFRNRFLSFYWWDGFEIWYTASEWSVVLCLPFSYLSDFYFLFAEPTYVIFKVKLTFSNFRNRFLTFYWWDGFEILYTASAWSVVPCLPFSVLSDFYFLFAEPT